jgi:hypothetical protein
VFKKACFLFLIILLAPLNIQAAERRLIEAEEFDGLIRYPYHNHDAQGWYARESNCRRLGAPGKGYQAQIHSHAAGLTAQKTISPALQPGKYKVFVRVIGHRWQDKNNAIRLRLGDARLDFKWQNINQFKWLDGKTVTLSSPVETIFLDAVQFGGKAYKHLYDTNDRTLIVDTIYITSDLSETSGPSEESAAQLEIGRELPVELLAKDSPSGHRQVKQTETPEPEITPVVTPIILKSFDQRKNMWPNSSFEIGGGDGWAAENHPGYAHIFDERDHIQGNAFHGDYCRRIPADSQGMSRPVMLPDGGTYALSLYLRGNVAKAVNIRLIRVTSGKDGRPIYKNKKQLFKVIDIRTQIPKTWTRFHGSGILVPGFYVLQVDSKADCLIDAVQFEPGPKPTAYLPRARLEAGVATAVMGNILYDNQPTKLEVWAHNSSDEDITSDFKLTVTDVRENTVVAKTIKISTPAGQTIRLETVLFDPPVRGLFSGLYSANDPRIPEGEIVFCVLPKPPDHVPRHALASNMDPLSEVHSLMALMGHKWQLYCKLKKDQPGNITPKPNRFNWEDITKVLRLAQENGFQTLPALWPTRVPPHLQDPARSSPKAVGDGTRDVVRRTTTKNIPAMPDLGKWESYCKEIGLHLADVAPLWIIEDETEMYYSPGEFAKILEAAVKGFRDSGQSIKTALSCTPDYTEELIEATNGKPIFNAFGGSSYNFEYWDSVKVRGLQNQYNMPWFSIGVGQSRQPQMNHSYPGYSAVYASAARTAREMVLLCLAQDARVLGHYTGRVWSRGGLYNVDFPLMGFDGTPLPHGFSFSCIPLLLADARPVTDIYLPALDTLVFVYEQNGRLGAVTWANNSPNLDIHWKTWPRTIKGFQVHGDVEIKDMYGNSCSGTRHDEAGLKIDLTEEPVFILNNSLTQERFIDMLRQAKADPPEMDMRLAFVPNGNNGVDLGVFVRNNTGRNMGNLKLDADFPPNRMLTKTSWMLPERQGQINDVPDGQTVLGRIPTVIGLDYPIENATFSVWLTDKEREYAWYERCWMTVAGKRSSIKIDGNIDDWPGVQPAWIYNTFGWSRFGRSFPHIVSGAENLKYVRRIDARAAIYAGYDDTNLYLALDCQDNHSCFEGTLDQRDHFVIKLKPDFMENFSPDGAGVVTIEAIPEDGKVRINGAPGVQGSIRNNDQGYCIELAIPLDLIKNGDQRMTEAVGFDVIWSDADFKGNDQGVCRLRWAGGSRSMGQLFFGE